MTLFFFVVGLEARREFDMGDLRDRRRLALPVAAGVGGMLVPVAIYLAVNAPAGSGRGWGTAMATDTAFALGMLALLGRRLPGRLRVFLLTVAVVDDLISLAVIGVFYSARIAVPALVVALALVGALLVVRARGVRNNGGTRGPAREAAPLRPGVGDADDPAVLREPQGPGRGPPRPPGGGSRAAGRVAS